ncbi:SRPBCC family protein [Tsukamurella sp. 8F]|uniref:SRPBCC family protein n=1 Tax=unclassified Tsukamurella TaxID=2633480 RepID=UPI0023B9E283|nr:MULTISPECIES: SRPBCC family protein [unclassified Tsukamurella]MDF0530513.1 SRPBCC family protein [Tsukamurella sp. 8J]MDF0586837.1 SRPBCC family protein [Tsukamurella sp. 8F]
MADHLTATRTVAASPAEVFAVLADPAQHRFTEPTDWVRDAVAPAPITEVGQLFGMDMFLEQVGGAYRMDNKVIAFEQDRTIGWQPGQTRDGEWGSGGWLWRYDLAPTDGGTTVTITYDWSAVPEQVRREFGGFPVFPAAYLDRSLAALETYVTTR